MRIYHFSEQPFPEAWGPENPSLRVSLASRNMDPRVMAEHYHHRLDEWLLADELGLDIMINEHHATATCATPVAAVPLAILARQTKRARLLTLGYPIANRLDPVRAAEELAMIDVISRGRLEMGFVRGVPYEVPLSQRSAVGQMDRFWEAHDLILKAMTSIDGPFDWQGEHFQYRNVNVWPRVWQQPHPPVWITGRSPQNIREIAERGYVLGTFLSGFQTKELFDHYRKAWADLGRPAPEPDRFSYLGIVAIAQDHKEAMRRAELMVGYLRTSGRVAEPFNAPPGYFSLKDAVRMVKARGARGVTARDGKFVDTHQGAIEDLVKAGIMFVGTPDEVGSQIADFNHSVGGLGHLLLMGHAGHLTHADAMDQITLLAREVLPRVQRGEGTGMTQRFLTLVFLLLGALPAAAQYPTKPVRLIVSFPPGGIADITARLISPRLAAALGQPVVVENRTGSGGNIGTEFVAKAPPDGHTLLIAPPPVAINVSLYKALPFDTRKDLAPVAILGGTTNVLVVGPKTAARTVQELIEQAKRNPGKLNFASNGNGTTIHLSGELLKLYAGFDARHIPYRGAPAAMAALLAGDVDFMFDALPPSAPHIKGGRVRLLAVTSRERQPMFPEAPTLVESGFPEFEVNSWTGLMTTGGTPQPVIARLESDLRRILADPEAVAAFEKTGMAVKFGSAGEFAALLDAEIRRWALAVKHSGAQAD